MAWYAIPPSRACQRRWRLKETQTIARCDTQTTVVQLQTWTSQASRDNGGQSVPDNWLPDGFSSLVVFTTDLNLQADNPVAYAYSLLEASGKYPTATWNV